jgi:hypothetical protein
MFSPQRLILSARRMGGGEGKGRWVEVGGIWGDEGMGGVNGAGCNSCRYRN